MATLGICIVTIVVAVTSATPTVDMGSSIATPEYRSSSTISPHEQQLQKTDYIPSDPYPTQATPRKVEESDSLFSTWRTVGRLLLDCSKSGDLVGCLKLKAVTSLGRALISSQPLALPLPFLEGVSLARDPETQVSLSTQALQESDVEIEASLPRALDERGVRLDRLLIDRLDAFLKTRTLQISVPLGMGFVEGRGKNGIGGKKGHGMMIMMIAGLKAMMMQSAMGGIAMMSGKALLVAKIALLLALLCCLKKGGGEEKSAQIVYAAPSSDHGGGGGGWQSSGSGGDWSKRSVTADPYSAYNPQNNSSEILTDFSIIPLPTPKMTNAPETPTFIPTPP